MPISFIPFDGWAPGGSYFGEGWGTVQNLYPAWSDWRPWRKFVPLGAGVADGAVTGTHVHVWGAGMGTGAYTPDAQTIFCGSSRLGTGNGKLYVVDPLTGAFTNVSRAALYSNAAAGWRFASVGNDIWGTNGLDPLQRRTGNAGLFADGVVSTFKPQPRFLRPVREHLVGANLSNAGHFQDEVVWSDSDDATNFDPPAGGSTSISIAGGKRLTSIPGQITGLVGGQYMLAFKRTGIFYGEYVGAPSIFNFDVLSTTVGTAYPSSIINSRYGIFFLGADGFYSIAGLSAPNKISPPGIGQVLLNSSFSLAPIAVGYQWSEDIQALGFQIPGFPLVGWALKNTQDALGDDYAILYNPVTQAWSTVDLTGNGTGGLVTALVQRPNALTLYDALAALTWNLTTVKYAPLSAVSSDALSAVAGLNFRPINIEDAMKYGQSQIKSILPIVAKTSVPDAALNPFVTVESLIDPGTNVWKSEGRPSSERDTITGWYPFMIAGRFMRITITFTAAEDFASFDGVFVDQDFLR